MQTRISSQHRRPILVLIGGTNLRKSLLAADVLRRVGDILGIHDFVEITVEDDGHLDFSGFDVARHAGVILDGIGDAQVLVDNRESLQGRPKVSFGGKSSTMMYSYPIHLVPAGRRGDFRFKCQRVRVVQFSSLACQP